MKVVKYILLSTGLPALCLLLGAVIAGVPDAKVTAMAGLFIVCGLVGALVGYMEEE